jgi:GntR family transcriptional regulator/MocR family aminotransferase
MIESLRRASGGALQLAPSAQGMHLAHEVGERTDDRGLSRRAGEAGVFLAPLSAYCVQAKRRGWLFGYAGFDDSALRQSARTLAPLIR